jgi:hypothetical protein
MGDFVVYQIEVATGRILQTYKDKEALGLFGDENLRRIHPDDEL